jgi:pimeloyl-ACP methyl ester carboxylesterase
MDKHISRRDFLCRTVSGVAALPSALGAHTQSPQPGSAGGPGDLLITAADWNGYEKREFMVDGVKGYVVMPRIAASGMPWVWQARFPNYHPEAATALLSKGFHVAYFDLPNIFGSPAAVQSFSHFYDYIVTTYGLSAQVALEGISRGGLFVYNWATKNPQKVTCIYCESPVCDLKSWPGGKGKGLGSPADWKQALASYAFTEEQMLAFRGNPIDELAPLAESKIALLHVVCERDKVVPPAENTAILAERYRKLGGSIVVHYNTRGPETLNGHHFPLDDPALEVNFILSHTPGRQSLAGTGMTPQGVEYFHLRDGLRNSLIHLEAGGSARVVFLGGSITNMKGWRDLVCEYLENRFPQTKFDFVNAGIPSTGSTPGAFRLIRDVFGRGPVDLLFEEAAVNDETNGFGPLQELRGMEGIVRHAREINRLTDIVLLHFVDPGKMEAIRSGRTPEVIQMHEKVANQYGLPSINLAREVTERIGVGEFEWKKDFRDVHPSPFGQTVYYRSIVRLLDAAWKEPVSPGAEPCGHPMPAALDERSYYRGRLVDIRDVSRGTGWKLDPDWRPTDGVATRPGFVEVPTLEAETPGSECRFTFDGTAVGIFVVAGPDAGMVDFSIDGRPFQRQDLMTQWSSSLHIPWAFVFDADLSPGRHELLMRVAADKNPSSKGHAVRIVAMLAN